MPMVRKRDSIYFQLFQLLILAALVSGLFFLVTNWAGDSLLNWFYISSNYEEKKNGEYIGRLQEYVSQNQLSTEDTKELTEWVRRQRVVALQLYKNGILMYDSEYPDQDMEAEQIEAGDYEWTVYYPVQFSDGEAEISIYGMYFYQYYNYAVIAELLLSFALFVGIVMLGIRYKIRYIRKLSSEIEILEGGSLDYEITVKMYGKDSKGDRIWVVLKNKQDAPIQLDQIATKITADGVDYKINTSQASDFDKRWYNDIGKDQEVEGFILLPVSIQDPEKLDLTLFIRQTSQVSGTSSTHQETFHIALK